MQHDETILHFSPGHSDVEGIDGLLEGGGAGAAALRQALGGKGSGLHALAARGFRVPSGFTLPTRRCAEFHAAGRVLPPGLREEVVRGIAALEARTGRRLGAGAAGLRVAVRSGAAASMPGMMDTVLDVGSMDAIIGAIERVFLSWASERACAYREKRGLRGLGGTAVVIQEMCPAEQAGVAFTIDPATGEEVVTVEAVRGLGETLVSGEVTPERHRFRRPGLEKIEERIPPAGPVLTAPHLRQVVTLALEVEAAFGHPVDIEWAVAGGEAWILQVRAAGRGAVAQERPGAGPGAAMRPAATRLAAESARLRALAGGGVGAHCAAVFIRHNLDQSLSHPTPMTWDVLGELFGAGGAFHELYSDLGFSPSRRVRQEGFLFTVCGRVFADPSRSAEMFYGTRCLGHDVGALRRRPDLLDGPPRTWNRSAATPLELLRTLWRMARAERRVATFRRAFPHRFSSDVLPRYLAWCRTKAAQDLSPLDLRGLLDELEERVREVYRRFPRHALKLSFLGAASHAELRDLLERVLGGADGARAATVLAATGTRDCAPDLNQALAALGRGDIGVEEFLSTHGHRAPGEMDLARPRWREEPDALAGLAPGVPPHRAAGAGSSSGAAPRTGRGAGGDGEAAAEAANVRIEQAFRRAGGEGAVACFHRRWDEARRLLPWREAWKHHWMLGVDLVRRVLVELDRRLGLEGGVFYLRRGELRRLVEDGGRSTGEDRERIRRRRDDERADRTVQLPDAIDLEDLDRLAAGGSTAREGLPAPGDSAWRGEPLSPGIGEGRAWIALDPGAPCGTEPPFVLVCPSTDPGWTPILARASAVVVERGGTLSHGAIVCRDFGVPAVLLPGATAALTAGALVRVDGGTGAIERRAEDGVVVECAGVPSGVAEHLPPEPWVPPPPPALARRALGGLAVAISASMALMLAPAARPLLEPVLRRPLDWTIDLGWPPWASIGFAALASALLAAVIHLAAGDRALLARMRTRLAWYRRSIREARRGNATAQAAELERRMGQASIERALELLRPVGWSFLPFCLGLLWVTDRFAAEPIRPGAAFTVRSVVRPSPRDPSPRHIRLDAAGEGSVRLLDPPFQKLQPNLEDPWNGPYCARWRVEAVTPGELVLAAATIDERVERRLLVTTRRELAPPGLTRRQGAGVPKGSGILSLEVEHAPVDVELPGFAFRAVDTVARWITGGREITPRQAALGPVPSFLLGSVLVALLLQRITGMR